MGILQALRHVQHWANVELTICKFFDGQSVKPCQSWNAALRCPVCPREAELKSALQASAHRGKMSCQDATVAVAWGFFCCPYGFFTWKIQERKKKNHLHEVPSEFFFGGVWAGKIIINNQFLQLQLIPLSADWWFLFPTRNSSCFTARVLNQQWVSVILGCRRLTNTGADACHNRHSDGVVMLAKYW